MEISQNRTVTPNQLKNALRVCAKVNRPTMITGSPGIGKSDIVQQLCDEMGGKMYDLRLSQMTPEDLRGLPVYDKDTKQMIWAPPVDLPSQEDAAKYPVVFLFLDELNSATPSVMAAAYQLILNRRVGTYVLPDNVKIFGAGNKSTDRGVTYNMPTPLKNRFIHFELRIDFASWYDWAINNRINSDVVGFLDYSNSSLCDFDPKSSGNSFATPRSWAFVSDIVNDTSLDDSTAMDIISGTIGEGLALKFMAYRKHSGNLPKPEDILSGKVTELKSKEISIVYSLITDLNYSLKDMWEKVGKTKDEDSWHVAANNVLGFALKNFPIEIQVLLLRTAMQKFNLPFTPKKLTNFKEYYDKVGKLIIKSVS